MSHNTVKTWLLLLERLYIVFTLRPYSTKIQRSIRKEDKIYLWDWSQVKDEGTRFENFIASHLLKAVHTWRDLGKGDLELHFVRDRDRREADFCLTKDNKPWLLIEAKLTETRVDESLQYFCNRLNVPGFQVMQRSGVFRKERMVTVISADRLLLQLP